MAQQISDAELEIMKIVWANPEERAKYGTTDIRCRA